MPYGNKAFCLLFILLLIVGFATQPSIALALYLVVCSGYVLANIRRLRLASRAEVQLLALMLLGPASFVAISIPRAGATVALHFLVAILSALAACIMTRNPQSYHSASKWGLVVSQAFVILFIARVGVTGFPLERLIAGHSSNGITSYMVALQVNYSVVTYVLRKRFTWATLVVTLAICVVGFGRGSILTATAMILASFVMSVMQRGGLSFIRRLALVLIAVVAVGAFWSEIILFADANTKIGAGLIDVNRNSMIAGYIGNLNPMSAILGGSYENTVIDRDFNSNPHNSYIRAHHIFGLVYLVVVLTLPFLAVWWSKQGRRDKMYILLLIMLLYFRAFTEPILFPTVFDFFCFGMCFIIVSAKGEWSTAPRARRYDGAPAEIAT